MARQRTHLVEPYNAVAAVKNLAPFTLFAVIIAASLMTYGVTAFVLVKVLKDRYRSVPVAHVTAAGAGIFVAGIGLLFVGGETFWEIPLHVALVAGSIGAAIVNVGATMIVGPWLVGLVASDLRRVPVTTGTRGTEAHLAISLVRIAGQYGGTVEYDRDGTYDFDVYLGRRDLRVELGAVTEHPAEGDVTTDPRGWFDRIGALIIADPPTELKPVLIIINEAMMRWLRSRDIGFGEFDDNPYFAFDVWDGRAEDDDKIESTIEALLFGITNAQRRAAVEPAVRGLGVSATPTPNTSTVPD